MFYISKHGTFIVHAMNSQQLTPKTPLLSPNPPIPLPLVLHNHVANFGQQVESSFYIFLHKRVWPPHPLPTTCTKGHFGWASLPLQKPKSEIFRWLWIYFFPPPTDSAKWDNWTEGLSWHSFSPQLQNHFHQFHFWNKDISGCSVIYLNSQVELCWSIWALEYFPKDIAIFF